MIVETKQVRQYCNYNTLEMIKISPVRVKLNLKPAAQHGHLGSVNLELFELEKIRNMCYYCEIPEDEALFKYLNQSIYITSNYTNKDEIVVIFYENNEETGNFTISFNEFYKMITTFMLSSYKNIIG